MAIVRCELHEPSGRTRSYVTSKEPIGYPETALVCGSKSCEAAGLVWLEEDEARSYERGQRIFQAFTATMKMRVA